MPPLSCHSAGGYRKATACREATLLTVDTQRVFLARSLDLIFPDSIVACPCFPMDHMTEAIPLGPRLSVDQDLIVKAVRTALGLVVNDRMTEPVSLKDGDVGLSQ